MFGKLLKYELRSSVKKMGVMWLAAAALLTLNSVSLHYASLSEKESFWHVMFVIVPAILLYIISLALVVMSFVFVVTRFYKGLLGDEGYLMFTLPVKPGQLIASKATAALIVQLISSIVSLLPLLVSVLFDFESFFEAIGAFDELFAMIDMNTALLLVEVVVLVLVSAVQQILMIYLSMALGHLAKKHRLGWSVGAYVGLSYALSALLSCAQMGFMCSSLVDEAAFDSVTSNQFFGGFFGMLILIMALLAAGEFLLTRSILTKKLNLE